MKTLAVRNDFDADEAVISALWEFARQVRGIEITSPSDLRLVEIVDKTRRRMLEIFDSTNVLGSINKFAKSQIDLPDDFRKILLENIDELYMETQK